MKAINYLERIETLDARIDALVEERARINNIATNMSASSGGEKVKSSGGPRKLETCVISLVDIDQEIDDCIRQKRAALDLINESCDKYCIELLYKRYFLGESWKTIAVQMHLSYKWVSGGLHQRALSQLQKGLDKSKPN